MQSTLQTIKQTAESILETSDLLDIPANANPDNQEYLRDQLNGSAVEIASAVAPPQCDGCNCEE
ncbi:MAG: hypothetical protein JRG71_01010 [Deltaproteobacteria bacterium]|nr:hypothetical protein [Deltaproteobacteria bacterium]